MRNITRKAYLSEMEVIDVLGRLELPINIKSVALVSLPINETFEFSVSSSGDLLIWRGWSVKLDDPVKTIVKLVSLGVGEEDVFTDPVFAKKESYIRFVKSGVNEIAYGLDVLANTVKLAAKSSPSELRELCTSIVNQTASVDSLLDTGRVTSVNGYLMLKDSITADPRRESHPLDIANLVNSLSEEYETILEIESEELFEGKNTYILKSKENSLPKLNLKLEVYTNVCKVTKI